jgi:hypothetical protein
LEYGAGACECANVADHFSLVQSFSLFVSLTYEEKWEEGKMVKWGQGTFERTALVLPQTSRFWGKIRKEFHVFQGINLIFFTFSGISHLL